MGFQLLSLLFLTQGVSVTSRNFIYINNPLLYVSRAAKGYLLQPSRWIPTLLQGPPKRLKPVSVRVLSEVGSTKKRLFVFILLRW